MICSPCWAISAIGWNRASSPNTVRLAVRAELVEAHSPFDRLRANELKRTVLNQVPANFAQQYYANSLKAVA